MSSSPTNRGVLDLYERAMRLTPGEIARSIRNGHCPPERSFDRFLPDDLRVASSEHWTPLAVAVRAARWLQELEVRSVVDLGSGAGKLCVAAALASSCSFLGLEHRPRLVAAARRLAEQFEVEDRARFSEGAVGEIDVPSADAYYLFNPFGENLYTADDWIDGDVELSEERYCRDVAAVEDLLRQAPVGTLVLTYNGFGGRIPWPYKEIRVDRELPSVLRMCQKAPGWQER